MLDLTVTVENGALVQARLSELANAARVFGASRASVSTAVSYGRFVIEGTGPHAILPRAKRALYWPGAAHPVRSVRHPGTKPNPFLEQAVASSSGEVEDFVLKQLDVVAAGGGSNYSQIMPGAANIVLEAARQAAPIGKGPHSGGLRLSLHTERA